jgi:hydroxyacylglutathione hydrolase
LFGIIISKFFKNPAFSAVNQDILVDDELKLNEFGVDGSLVHTPGHTPSSLTIVLPSSEIIVGDMLSGKKIKNGYKAYMPIFATDIFELKESLKKITVFSPEKIYNSHGDIIDVAAV